MTEVRKTYCIDTSLPKPEPQECLKGVEEELFEVYVPWKPKATIVGKSSEMVCNETPSFYKSSSQGGYSIGLKKFRDGSIWVTNHLTYLLLTPDGRFHVPSFGVVDYHERLERNDDIKFNTLTLFSDRMGGNFSLVRDYLFSAGFMDCFRRTSISSN